MTSAPTSAKTKDTCSPSTTLTINVEASENIKVVVRCRPLSKKEKERKNKVVVAVDTQAKSVTATSLEAPLTDVATGSGDNKDYQQAKTFTFDHVFSMSSSQEEVYNAVARPIVQNVLEGYNGTIFAYGQTGTGKTFTMEGSKEMKGIIPNSFAQIFSSIAEAKEGQRYLVRCSYLEIYNENIRDLLCKDQTQFLELKENKDREVYVKDLSSLVVVDAEDMDRVMTVGNKNRSVAATNMNSESSRSHAIFSIVVECSTDMGPEKSTLRMGKLNLVDLAGSERVSKTLVTGDRLKEATKINLSLSNLGNVISALVDGSSYIPYRNSKLTRLLQDSLGGNSKTVMVATIGPSHFNYDETISTLRYANRAKNIKNCAKINEDPKDAILRQYQEEILRLRALLEQKKHELQEKSQQNVDESGEMSSNKASRKNKLSSRRDAPDTIVKQSLGTLLEEQKRIEEKQLDELRALLEPYGINVDVHPKGIMDELERRKAALMKDGEEVKEVNKKLYDELEQTTKAMLDSKRQCKELFHRVLSLEGQIQKSQMTHEELKSKEKELEEQNLREATLRKTLEQKKLTSSDLKEELSKLQHEIEGKQKKITKFRCKVGEHKDKTQMLQGDHLDNLKQLQILRNELTRELKLKTLIVDNFIPRKVRRKIEDRIRFDDVADKYILAPRTDTTFEQPPVNRMLLNPFLNLSRFPRLPKQNNVYYSNENLLAVEPEPPVPRSQELMLEEEDPAIANLIAETMRELNQELVIVCDHRKGRIKSNF